MSFSHRIRDFESLSSELPEKPSSWKLKQMKKFLKYIKMEDLCAKFEDLEITGKIFLDLKRDSEILEDLSLSKKEEKLLLGYKKSLLEYEEKLKTPKKNSKEMEIMKKSLAEALNKKEVKIENPKYFLEEDNSNDKSIKNLQNTHKKPTDGSENSENNSQKNKAEKLKKKKMEKDSDEEFPRKEEKFESSRKEKNIKKQKNSKVEENLDFRTKNNEIHKDEKQKNNKNKTNKITSDEISDMIISDNDKKKAAKNQTQKKKNSKVTSSDSDDEDYDKKKPAKKEAKNDKITNDNSLDSAKKKDNKYAVPPKKVNSSLFLEENENSPTIAIDRFVTKKKLSDINEKDPTIPYNLNKPKPDLSKNEDNKIATIRTTNGLSENTERTDQMYGPKSDSKINEMNLKKNEQRKKETNNAESTDRIYPRCRIPAPYISKPENIKNIFGNTKYDGPTSGSEDDNPGDKATENTQGTSSTNICKKRELILEVHQGNKLNGEEYSLKMKHISLGSFSISRNEKKSQYDLQLLDPKNSVSRDQAHVVLIKNRGFYIQNRSSSVDTFIFVEDRNRIILKEGMEILMAASIFKVKTLKKDEITMEVSLDIMKVVDPHSKIKILEIKCAIGEKSYFGADPIYDEEANRFVFTDDKSIKETQAVFYYEKIQDQMFLEPFGYGMKLFFKLETNSKEKSESPYYLILNDKQIRIGLFVLNIEKTFYLPAMVCHRCRNKFTDCFFTPCLHCDICYECAQESKKCSQSSCNSKEFKRLIDPYH